MRQVVVLSGKGGTGKTSVTASLAHLASQDQNIILVDADVDASNLELVLKPTVQEEHTFMGMDVAVIDTEKCKGHGDCAEVCRFQAVHAYQENGRKAYAIEAIACEGCASCYYQCPAKAIEMVPQQAGLWFRSETAYGPLFHADLFAGQPNSGKLVTLVKQHARQRALETGRSLMLVDGPPGIGCPVISTLSGADLAILVVEPTLSSIHDLERIMATVRHFGVTPWAVINKADLNSKQAKVIEAYCQDATIPVLGQIPFDSIMTEAMVQGVPVTTYNEGPVTQALQAIWDKIKKQVVDSTTFLPVID
jgi:MinD superfamily P-loop ATPase